MRKIHIILENYTKYPKYGTLLRHFGEEWEKSLFKFHPFDRVKHKNMNLHKHSQSTNNQLFTKMVRSMKRRILPPQFVNQKSLERATNKAND